MREFPQPADFPRPSLYPYIALTVLVCVVLGVVFFRKNRKARAWDAFFWVVAGIMLSYLFLEAGRDDYRVRPTFELGARIVWIPMLAGCMIGWVKLIRQKQIDYLILSLLLVVAAFLIFPGLHPNRRTGSGRFAQCQNNVQMLGMAFDNYHDAYLQWPQQQAGDPPHSWRVTMLPYLDHAPLYHQYDFTATWDSEVNRPITNRHIFVYHCPSNEGYVDGNPFPTSYALFIGDDAAWRRDGLIDPEEIPDGSSYTAILGEACGLGIIWTEPRDVDLATSPVGINIPGDAPGESPSVLSSYHPLGAHVLMADGHVRPIPIDTDPEVLKAMLTSDGGEEVEF